MPVRHTPRQQLVFQQADQQLEWIHLGRNLPQDVDYLKRRFHFHAIDLRETLPPLQRHKLVIREELGYAFMILIFPVFDRKTRIISSVEVDFFIKPGLLVTVSNGPLPALEQYVEQCKRDAHIRQEACEKGEMHLTFNVLDQILESLFPMLLHLSSDIDEVEKDLFESNQRRVIMEILRIKTNIVNVRKAMQGHKKVIEALLQTPHHVPSIDTKTYFDELIEHIKEIWDSVELQRDTINALHETHASLIENRTNDIIKTLTMISVVTFPLTLIAAIFAMDVGSVPFREDPFGFYKVALMFLVVAGGMLAYFVKRRWF